MERKSVQILVFQKLKHTKDNRNHQLYQWFYDYCVLDEQDRRKRPPNMKMIFGGIIGKALQDIIVHKLTIKEVMNGKKT